MPVSKKRKKKGKKVRHSEFKRRKVNEERFERLGDRESSVTLQDLINVVAYQEHHGLSDEDPIVQIREPYSQEAHARALVRMGVDAPSWAKDSLGEHTVIAEDAEIHMPEIVPVTIGEGDDKREIGTASRIPGDEEHLSVNITAKDVLDDILGSGNYSIDKEND